MKRTPNQETFFKKSYDPRAKLKKEREGLGSLQYDEKRNEFYYDKSEQTLLRLAPKPSAMVVESSPIPPELKPKPEEIRLFSEDESDNVDHNDSRPHII